MKNNQGAWRFRKTLRNPGPACREAGQTGMGLI